MDHYTLGGRGGILGAASETKAANAPLAEYARVVQRVSQLSERVFALAERLVGAHKEDSPPLPPASYFGGFMGALEHGVASIDGTARMAEDALNRIEKALP